MMRIGWMDFQRSWWTISCTVLLVCQAVAQSIPVFPGEHWQERSPAEAGMDAQLLDSLVDMLGGRGCVVADGYIVRSWGDQSERSDWMSAVKPVFSTMLFFAVEEGKLTSVDAKIRKLGWPLLPKDRSMTFAHLANMISGYARPEKPGRAWAYNDYAIQLYHLSLFDRVFKQPATEAFMQRLGVMQFEHKLDFREDKPRIRASVRDFARIGLFWLSKGNWAGNQILPRKYFDRYMKPHVPRNLPHTKSGPKTHNDYLGIGTFGGGSDHFVDIGAGIYGFNWWFNGTGRLHPDKLTWPDATPKTFMAVGAGGNVLVVIPEHHLILASAKGDWGSLEKGVGKSDGKFNRAVKLLLASYLK